MKITLKPVNEFEDKVFQQIAFVMAPDTIDEWWLGVTNIDAFWEGAESWATDAIYARLSRGESVEVELVEAK